MAPRVFVPAIARLFPGFGLEGVIQTENAEGRNDVFLEIFVLVITKNDDEIRLVVIKDLALLVEAGDQAFAVPRGGGDAAVAAHFGDHVRGPVLDIPEFRVNVRRL